LKILKIVLNNKFNNIRLIKMRMKNSEGKKGGNVLNMERKIVKLTSVSSVFREAASTEVDIKNIEVNYRGVFQKTLARRICKPIVYAAKEEGKTGFGYGRYSDAPERDGVPCKYFAVVADLTEEDLEAEAGGKVEPNDVDVSIVVDDTMTKGVEPWAYSGIRPISEKVKTGGTLLVVSERNPLELLKNVEKKKFPYKIAVVPGMHSFSGLWVYKDDLTDVRVLGALARVDSDIVSLQSIKKVVGEQQGEERVRAVEDGYNSVVIKSIAPGEGIVWPYKLPELPKWHEFQEGIVVKPVKRGGRNEDYKRFTTRTMRPVIRFDKCIKCDRCWYTCPDECFDPTPEGLFDVNYNYCVGCGRCAEVCPVPNTIVMIDELKFDTNESPYQKFKESKDAYTNWAEEKKGKTRVNYPFVTGTGLSVEEAKTKSEEKR
jgi:pyruvate ferredoxin oxidoreductase delta subunit